MHALVTADRHQIGEAVLVHRFGEFVYGYRNAHAFMVATGHSCSRGCRALSEAIRLVIEQMETMAPRYAA